MNNPAADLPRGDILIVDDNPNNLRLLSTTLAAQGYAVRKALNGQRAIASARAEPPDLILLDIKMPEMDGYEVCQHLKADEQTRAIPVIFISALDEVLDKVKAFSAGGVDYIAKPFQNEEVLARVRTHLTLHHLTQKLEQQVEQRTAQLNHALHDLQQAQQQLERSFEEVLKAKEIAENANHSKSNFLANMSHELCTPLNAIVGFSELLQMMAKDSNLEEEWISNIQEIHNSGWHLYRLVNNILKISKLEAGQKELRLDNCDVSQLVEEVVDRVRPLAEKKQNQLEVRYTNNPGIVRSDRAKIHDILFHILENACKFTVKGRIILTVARHDEIDPAEISFQVSDTGVGIAPEELSRIFQPFTQVDESSTREYGGAGLGLAIAQQLCQIMGGAIAVSSELGQGSTFSIRLPATGVAA